jgi:N-acetylmuramoyl-L-alanine amidase
MTPLVPHFPHTPPIFQSKPWRYHPSPNHSARKLPVDTLVLHYTGVLSTESTLRWFARKDAKVSAHFVIGRDGEIVRCVEDDRVAWHAGVSQMPPPDNRKNVNAFSLGIELVATPDSGFTDVQMSSLYEIVTLVVAAYKIPPERVVGHKAIARPVGRKIDPDGFFGQFNWAKTRSVAQAAYERVLANGAQGKVNNGVESRPA